MAMEREHLEADLGTASFLVVRGFRLLGLTQNSAGRYSFRFENREGKAEEAALDYLQGESVPAKALIAAERDLKTLLYGKKRGYGNGGHSER
jgi:hypothetical protein